MRKFSSLILIAALSVVIGFTTQTVSAVTGADWQAGNIIDDGIFYDNTTMSANDIQVFLNSKVPTCDTNGTKPNIYNPNQTNAQYAAARGWPGPPYVCLKDYHQVPRSDQNINNLSTNVIPAGAISAAQIIKNAADTYGVNSKALIVILQKESPGPLVTDDWPLPSQYRNAMGYGCPDTAPCDPAYEGFYNQMMNAARQFKLYKDNPGSYRYKPFQVNSIYYNPNYGCGASDVNITNYATAGLYNYTPYQPNQTALNNLYGTGDGCSAYGNRNFWRMYNDWFGSTHGPALGWQLQQQSVYTDQTKTTPAGLDNLAPNQRVFASITVRNTGNDTWSNGGANPIRLGTYRPAERSSQLHDSTWLSKTRIAGLKEASVAPGQTGTFEFWLHAPLSTQTINFKEYFNLVSEGKQWLPDIGLYYSGSVQAARYTWSMASQYAYTDQTKSTQANMNTLMPGQRIYVGFTAKNTGNMTWSNSGPNALMAGTASPFDRVSKFAPGSGWLAGSRPSLMKEASVAPGQTGTFEFWMTVPASGVSGVYNERFGLIANDLTWLNDTGLSYYMNVR